MKKLDRDCAIYVLRVIFLLSFKSLGKYFNLSTAGARYRAIRVYKALMLKNTEHEPLQGLEHFPNPCGFRGKSRGN